MRGIVPGFGRAWHVDPYFSPEIIANRKWSLSNLNKDSFDLSAYAVELGKTIVEIRATIEAYASRDAEFAAISEKAQQVFELGNARLHSYPAFVLSLEESFTYVDSAEPMRLGEALVKIMDTCQFITRG